MKDLEVFFKKKKKLNALEIKNEVSYIQFSFELSRAHDLTCLISITSEKRLNKNKMDCMDSIGSMHRRQLELNYRLF